jgi:hypothetical protein
MGLLIRGFESHPLRHPFPLPLARISHDADDCSDEFDPGLRLAHFAKGTFIEMWKAAAKMCTESMVYGGASLARPRSWNSNAKSRATLPAF